MKKYLKVILIISIAIIIIIILAIIAFVIYRQNKKNNFSKKQQDVILTQPESKQEPEQESPVQKSKIEFKFLREKEIVQGYQVRMLLAHDLLYISHKKPDRSIAIKTYNTNLEPQGEEIILKEAWTPDYKIVFSGDYFYLVDAYNLRKYDLNWNKVKSVSYFEQLPLDIAEQWKHGVDDMILSYLNGSIYIGTAIGNALPESMKGKEKEKKPDLADNLYLQEYDANLELKNKLLLKDVGNTPGSSIASQKKDFIIITGDKHWDDSSLIMLRYDQNWQLLERKIISQESQTNEEFPMTTIFDNKTFYVGYHSITGDISQPVVGEPIRTIDLVVKAYDINWNLLGRLPKENNITESNPQSVAGGWFDLVLVGDKMYLVLDNMEGKVILKEYLIMS